MVFLGTTTLSQPASCNTGREGGIERERGRARERERDRESEREKEIVSCN